MLRETREEKLIEELECPGHTTHMSAQRWLQQEQTKYIYTVQFDNDMWHSFVQGPVMANETYCNARTMV